MVFIPDLSRCRSKIEKLYKLNTVAKEYSEHISIDCNETNIYSIKLSASLGRCSMFFIDSIFLDYSSEECIVLDIRKKALEMSRIYERVKKTTILFRDVTIILDITSKNIILSMHGCKEKIHYTTYSNIVPTVNLVIKRYAKKAYKMTHSNSISYAMKYSDIALLNYFIDKCGYRHLVCPRTDLPMYCDIYFNSLTSKSMLVTDTEFYATIFNKHSSIINTYLSCLYKHSKDSNINGFIVDVKEKLLTYGINVDYLNENRYFSDTLIFTLNNVTTRLSTGNEFNINYDKVVSYLLLVAHYGELKLKNVYMDIDKLIVSSDMYMYYVNGKLHAVAGDPSFNTNSSNKSALTNSSYTEIYYTLLSIDKDPFECIKYMPDKDTVYIDCLCIKGELYKSLVIDNEVFCVKDSNNNILIDDYSLEQANLFI